ncbi:poly-gamma-glutamate hydrolase family protein [Streptomyces sp. MUM 203J]|uniref:poly-gamma-glutamate hydrolase family protein n=1 Tax=Streptomyces sp. MUM 203J TaxID=2791990 RepID=UPI0023D95817|nr:poly-gamma-glutamate hydrolase family protein [Streptomyces sp. MUM 203J]
MTDRRTVLTALAGAAVSGPLPGGLLTVAPAHPPPPRPTSARPTPTSARSRRARSTPSTPADTDGTSSSTNSHTGTYPCNRTTVLAMRGGGIETGTSGLCLGTAGDGRGVHDYWMSKGLCGSNNRELHVTAKHNDDHACLSTVRSSLNALSLHGCTAEQAGTGPEAVVVGGLDGRFKDRLRAEFTKVGIARRDCDELPDPAGVNPDNACNRTMPAKGGRMEFTTDLPAAMFSVNTRAGRAGSTTREYGDSFGACRAALPALHEGPDQVVLRVRGSPVREGERTGLR